jgi:hypothetical protein
MKNKPKQIVPNEPYIALLIVSALYKLLSTTDMLGDISMVALLDWPVASQMKNNSIKKNTKAKTNH